MEEEEAARAEEKEVVVTIAKHVIEPLFTTLYEKGYAETLTHAGMSSVVPVDLGIGLATTWHGSTELRIRGCEVITTDTDLLDDEDWEYDDNGDDSGAEGDGDEEKIEGGGAISESVSDDVGTNVSAEGKPRISFRRHISQLNVVCLFTENNLANEANKDLNSAIPTILFNKNSFMVSIFDCEKDVLLISSPCALVGGKGNLSKTAAIILWIVINHR